MNRTITMAMLALFVGCALSPDPGDDLPLEQLEGPGADSEQPNALEGVDLGSSQNIVVPTANGAPSGTTPTGDPSGTPNGQATQEAGAQPFTDPLNPPTGSPSQNQGALDAILDASAGPVDAADAGTPLPAPDATAQNTAPANDPFSALDEPEPPAPSCNPAACPNRCLLLQPCCNAQNQCACMTPLSRLCILPAL